MSSYQGITVGMNALLTQMMKEMAPYASITTILCRLYSGPTSCLMDWRTSTGWGSPISTCLVSGPIFETVLDETEPDLMLYI